MSNVANLIAQRAELDAQIAAQKADAVKQVRDFMTVVGVTIEDLVGPARPAASKRPAAYRNAAGQTWTGIGQRPRWLREALLAGATLDQFRVR